jgi:hypothetical protein
MLQSLVVLLMVYDFITKIQRTNIEMAVIHCAMPSA